MKKKVIGTKMLLALIIATFSLTGCNGKKVVEQTGIDLTNEPAYTDTVLPITDEEVVLTVWTPNSSQGYVKSYNDFEAYKILEKKTGVKLEFVHPTGTAGEQLNIMLASRDTTDIIYYYFYGNTGRKLIEDGSIIDLTEYIDKWAPTFRTILAEDEDIAKQMRRRGDQIYFFPNITDNVKFSAYNGYFIRKDWLDKAGLSIPTTIDEWEVVLTAFRDGDFNGNGQKDEVPFSTYSSGFLYMETLAGGFGLPSFNPGYYRDPVTKKVTHCVLQPQLKDFLSTLSRWYKEGLLNPNYATASTDELDSLVLNNQLGAFYADNNNSLPKYVLNNPDMELAAVPYPKNAEGISYHPAMDIMERVSSRGAAISTNCKNVKEAVRYFDYLYTKDASDLMYWGVEGESYTKDDNGNYRFTDLIIKNPDGKTPYEAICKYMTNTGFVGMHQYKAMLGLETQLTDTAKKLKEDSVNYSIEADKSMALPTTIALTPEENDRLAAIENDMTTYLNEMYVRFILGAEPMSEFDAFVARAKSLGIEEAIQIRQIAYDRAN